MSVQLRTALGCMRMIASYGRQGLLNEIGISPSDYLKVAGEKPWIASDRVRVVNSINALLMASVDGMMLPRFQLSAEYIAAGICVFVSPVNIKAACRLLENAPSAQSLGRGQDEQEVIYAKELGGLCDQIFSDPECSAARHQFERRVNEKIKEAERKGGEPDVQKAKR
jgi:hypothetical protein